jgi:hypothetical protein
VVTFLKVCGSQPSVRAMCPAHLILLDSVTRIIVGKDYIQFVTPLNDVSLVRAVLNRDGTVVMKDGIALLYVPTVRITFEGHKNDTCVCPRIQRHYM